MNCRKKEREKEMNVERIKNVCREEREINN
jgi:hypothetical protein